MIAVVALVFVATTVQAQAPKASLSVTLGDKVVLLPAPEAFEEVTSQWETAKRIFAATVPADGDLLAGYLRASDLDLLRKGQVGSYSSWVTVSILREGRTHVSDKAEFARIVGYALQDGEKLTNPDRRAIKDGLANLDKVLSTATSKDVKIDVSKPKVLGTFDRRPDVFSNLLLIHTKVNVDGKEAVSTPVLAAMTLVLVKQRIIGVYTYKNY